MELDFYKDYELYIYNRIMELKKEGFNFSTPNMQDLESSVKSILIGLHGSHLASQEELSIILVMKTV